jgi:hypothetical protein
VTARELFRVAEAAAARAPDGYLPGDAGRILASFREEFIEAGRCPADELLAQWRSRPEEVSIWI